MRQGSRPVALILLTILCAVLFLGFTFHQRNPIDTDILSLLPGDRGTPVLADALNRMNAVASNRVTMLIEGGTAETRSQAAADLTAALIALGLFQSSAADGRALWDWVFAHRSGLLCPSDRTLLQDSQGAVIARDALTQWYTPFGFANSSLLKADPLLLTPRLMKCLLGSAVPVQSAGAWTLVSGGIGESVFRTDVQDRIIATIADWQGRWKDSGITLSRAGAVFHAAHAAENARWQMSVISLVTVALILLIYRLVFGTMRPALIAVLLISSCLVVGLAVALALFADVHIMVIVFAAALIGMVVDYSTYYLITGVATPAAGVAERRATIFRPLTLGMVTSVGAFAALLFVAIPAFREIALVGGVGLFFAWATALYLLPLLEGRIRSRTRAADWMQVRVGQVLAKKPSSAWIGAVVAATAIVGAAAWLKGGTVDDVRRFQTASRSLAAEEAHIREATGFAASGAFFLVTGASAEATKAHEEALLAAIGASPRTLVVLAASRVDPSAATLATQQKLVRERLLAPELRGLLGQLHQPDTDPYAVAAEAQLPPIVAALRGQAGAIFWSVVPVAVPAAEVPPALQQDPSWSFVDPAAVYSSLLERYRWIASFGLIGGTVIIGVILLLVYRRPAALWIMLPTVLAMIATPAILALLGLPYSFFSAMGLFLVIGAGVDYSIFQWEHAEAQGHWTRLGIALAALMTCTSLGLLGFSSVLPVASFGMNVALGIFLSLILSPIAIFGRSRTRR